MRISHKGQSNTSTFRKFCIIPGHLKRTAVSTSGDVCKLRNSSTMAVRQTYLVNHDRTFGLGILRCGLPGSANAEE